MKSRFMKRMLSFILATVLLMGNVMPVMAEGSVSGNEVAETVVEETVVEESAVSEEPVSESEINIEEESSEVSTTETTEETSSVESTTEESTEEETTEVSTEESTEEETEESTEDSVSENEIPEDELSVSANEIIDEEVPLAGALPVSLEPVTVNGITITVSGPASAFAEGTTVSAVEVEPAEVVIEALQENEEAKVVRYKVFDINLVYEGEFVQPLNGKEITVNFAGDLLIQDEEDENVVVYHVDEDDSVTKMETEASDEDGSIDMMTTHFSLYAVASMVPGFVEVTVNHYLGELEDETKRLFLPNTQSVERGGKLVDFISSTADFTMSRIDIVEESVSDNGNVVKAVKETFTTKINEYTVTTGKDVLTINVYYNETVHPERLVPTVFYDYDDVDMNSAYNNESRSGTYYSNSINYYRNYGNYTAVTFDDVREQIAQKNPKDNGVWIDGHYEGGETDEQYEARLRNIFYSNFDSYDIENDEKNWDNRIATKTAYMTYEKEINGLKINSFEGDNGNVITGLIDYSDPLKDDGTPNFTSYDPGFFTTAENTYGTKHVYGNYQLAFNRTGLEYELTGVVQPEDRDNDGENDRWTELYNNFFPLGSNNWFFGMSYGFDFVIGDYLGDMKYKFIGDDDLWVILDNEVILDLGGLHQEVEREVDIWGCLIKKDPNATVSYQEKKEWLTEENQKKPHSVKIFYMERGGHESNCYMRFKMPNIAPITPDVVPLPKANIELLKRDSIWGNPIEKVGFTVYKEDGVTPCNHPLPSDKDGRVTIENLLEGTYYLEETFYDTTAYMPNTTTYKIVVASTENGDVSAVVLDEDNLPLPTVEDQGEIYIIENTPLIQRDLVFYKVDKYKRNPLEVPVTFTLREVNSSGKLLDTVTSNLDGSFVFEDISAGTYYLEEEPNVEGYKPVNDGWTIVVSLTTEGTLTYDITSGPTNLWINDDGTTEHKKLILNDPYVSVQFTKIDSSTKKGIEGVTFNLYKGNAKNLECNEWVSQAVSNKDGIVKFEKLSAYQEYLLVETTPEGYVEVKKPWIVKVVCEEKDGEKVFIQEIFNTKSNDNDDAWIIDGVAYENAVIENTPAKGSLEIVKTVDLVESVHGVASFTFEITYNEVGKEFTLYRTISFEGDIKEGKKTILINDLPIGSYTVKELPTLRYTCSDDEITNEVTANETTSFEFDNVKTYFKNYSHADAVVNKVTFNKNVDGTISSVKDINNQKDECGNVIYEKTSTSDDADPNKKGE